MSDESDYDSASEDEQTSGVQLGFVEMDRNDLFLNKNWSDWDGGKIGGWPVGSFRRIYYNTYYIIIICLFF